MKNKNLFWGIFFLAAAVLIIACQTGAFVHIGFWSIAATVLLAAVLISSLARLNFFGMFIPLALLYLIYQHPLHLARISFWLLLLAALFASIGLSMIVRPHRRDGKWNSRHENTGSEESVDGNDIYVKSSFGESCKYLRADGLKKARLVSSFGKLGVYFDQVRLSPEGAEVNVDVSFGEMSLFIPRSWRVTENVRTGLGAVNKDAYNNAADAGAPALTLTGNVSFGSLEIHYV